MKTHIILTLLAACALVSCSTTSSPLVVESDTGRIHPASHLDSLRGMASGKRDAEAMRFADAIIAKAGQREVDESGTIYPGTVKVLRWDEGRKYTAQRFAVWPDGSHGWQGPTPPSGFYGSKLETEILTRPTYGQRCIIHYPSGDQAGTVTDIIGTAHEVTLDNGKRENVFRFNPDEISLL